MFLFHGLLWSPNRPLEDGYCYDSQVHIVDFDLIHKN